MVSVSKAYIGGVPDRHVNLAKNLGVVTVAGALACVFGGNQSHFVVASHLSVCVDGLEPLVISVAPSQRRQSGGVCHPSGGFGILVEMGVIKPMAGV